MKLFICTECGDVQRMLINETRWCLCGESWGRYVGEPQIIKEAIDGKDLATWENVRVGGKARVFGISNQSFGRAGKGILATFEGWFYDTGYIETDTIEYTKEVFNELKGTTETPD